MKSKNLDIQFFKFLYSCIIVIYHLAAHTSISCPGGYCGVEFFLLSAGLFLFMSFEKGEERGKPHTPGQYLFRRFSRFLPWSATGLILTIFVEYVLIKKVATFGAWADLFAKGFWEFFMVNMNGMNNDVLLINGPAWTLSAMLIVGFFIWVLMYYYKKPFIQLIMPLTLVIGFGIWAHLPSANTERWIGFTNFGTFRTWLIFCLSYYCLQLGKKMSGVSFTKAGKWGLTITELLCHTISLVIIFARAERYYQWLITFLFGIAIAIAISGHSYLAEFLGKFKGIQFLGDVSMSIYLVHSAVILLFLDRFSIKAWGYADLLPLFAAVLVVSLAHYYGTKLIVYISDKIRPHARKVLIKE